MDDLLVGDLVIPGDELEERFETSGGPGGQHANRSQTAVTLRFDIAGSSLPEEVKRLLMSRLGPMVEVKAADRRSQARNRELARARLAERIAAGLQTPKRRKPSRPTKASRERRLADKRARAETKRQRRRPEPPT